MKKLAYFWREFKCGHLISGLFFVDLHPSNVHT